MAGTSSRKRACVILDMLLQPLLQNGGARAEGMKELLVYVTTRLIADMSRSQERPWVRCHHLHIRRLLSHLCETAPTGGAHIGPWTSRSGTCIGISPTLRREAVHQALQCFAVQQEPSYIEFTTQKDHKSYHHFQEVVSSEHRVAAACIGGRFEPHHSMRHQR